MMVVGMVVSHRKYSWSHKRSAAYAMQSEKSMYKKTALQAAFLISLTATKTRLAGDPAFDLVRAVLGFPFL